VKINHALINGFAIYGTIAVLVRARSHLESIAQQLKDDDINFESVEITKLQSHLLTRDLFSPN
jgi:superfamily I DNA/RNA helicase